MGTCYQSVAGHILHSLTGHFAEAEVLRKCSNRSGTVVCGGEKLCYIFLNGNSEQLGEGTLQFVCCNFMGAGIEEGVRQGKHFEMAHT